MHREDIGRTNRRFKRRAVIGAGKHSSSGLLPSQRSTPLDFADFLSTRVQNAVIISIHRAMTSNCESLAPVPSRRHTECLGEIPAPLKDKELQHGFLFNPVSGGPALADPLQLAHCRQLSDDFLHRADGKAKSFDSGLPAELPLRKR